MVIAGSLALATTRSLAQDSDLRTQPPGQPGTAAGPVSSVSSPRYNSEGAQRNRRRQKSETWAHPISCRRASRIIGVEVQSSNGDFLGKVRDLVVSLGSDGMPFALVAYGGFFGLGETRVAVALDELNWSANYKVLVLPATKEQFAKASPTPLGTWAEVANREGTREIDRFYGQPGVSRSSDERQEIGNEPSRRQPAGGDGEIASAANGLIENTVGDSVAHHVKASVDNGVVTLKGRVSDSDLRTTLENEIKGIPGVARVEDQLAVKEE